MDFSTIAFCIQTDDMTIDEIIKCDIQHADVNGVRHYKTPSGEPYPSVTSVLRETKDTEALDAWRERIGEAEAQRIMEEAANRGSHMHALIEKHHINGGSVTDEMKAEHEDGYGYYMKMLPLLSNFGEIKANEIALWSDNLKVAGRCDCIAEYKGELSIIDYKSSRAQKRADWIEDYFLQCTLYSMMLYELTGIAAKKIVVLISPETGKAQEFIRDTKYYVRKAMSRVRLYHNRFGSSGA